MKSRSESKFIKHIKWQRSHNFPVNLYEFPPRSYTFHYYYYYVCMCIFLKAFSKDCPVHLAHQAHIPSFLVCLSSKTFHIFLWHDGATVTLHCCLVFQPLSFGSRMIFMSLEHRRQFLTTFCSCNKMNVWWNIVWFYEGSLDLEDKCKSCLFLWKKMTLFWTHPQSSVQYWPIPIRSYKMQEKADEYPKSNVRHIFCLLKLSVNTKWT